MPLLITEFSGRARCIIKVSSAEETWRLLANIIALARARKRAKSRRLSRRPPAVSSSTFEAPFEAFLFSHLSRSSVSRILLHCVSSLSLVRSPSRLSIYMDSHSSLSFSPPPPSFFLSHLVHCLPLLPLSESLYLPCTLFIRLFMRLLSPSSLNNVLSSLATIIRLSSSPFLCPCLSFSRFLSAKTWQPSRVEPE